MEPMRMSKVLRAKPWGGRKLETHCHIALPENETIGESWELSDRGEFASRVAEGNFTGKSLHELLEQRGAEILGAEVFSEYGAKLPILVKLLDIQDKLSVQVHPDDAYAAARGQDFGKPECWYVLDASADAKVIMGMRPGVSLADCERAFGKREFLDLCETRSVQAGDFIFLHTGLVHATVSGSVLLFEVSRNSDLTYRIYDFDRVTDGQMRPLHRADALATIYPEVRAGGSAEKERTPVQGVEELWNGPYFRLKHVHTQACFVEQSPAFAVVTVVAGEGTLNQKESLRAGHTWLIPAGVPCEIEPASSLRFFYVSM